MIMKTWLAAVTLCIASGAVQALDLTLAPGDLRIEQRNDGGYHLYVRAKPGIACVLLTETTKDPALKADNYAYRAKEKNAVNGDEKRLLDGKFLPPDSKLYSLIDSTPEPDAALGSAFHVFIPWVVEYGYEWSRHGEVFLSDGTFINIRTFEKPYGDYAGAFKDNPYMLRLTQRPAPRPAEKPAEAPATPPPETPPKPQPAAEEPPSDLYHKDTVTSFKHIAEDGAGVVKFSEGKADITDKLEELLDRAKGKSLDLVVCLDTTESMKDDIDAVKTAIPEMVNKRIKDFKSFRFGVVLYKDYFEDYVVRRYDFTSDIAKFTSWVGAVRVQGGRDIPEAVYEALYEALGGYPWGAEARMIVLVGDAPPHPIPRGKVDQFMVAEAAKRLGVELDVIILPH